MARRHRPSGVPEHPDSHVHAAWHTLAPQEVARQLGVDLTSGLEPGEAARRLQVYGPNRLPVPQRRSAWLILLDQLASVMVLVLALGIVVSALMQDLKDAGAILAILVLNTALGFFQEYRAERAMAALRELEVPRVYVRRGAAVQEMSATELVPGDIVLIEAGDRIPADGRVIEAVGLRVDEAALTGESEPVDKTIHPLADPSIPLADRRNMVYMGTLVVAGRGVFVVTATGLNTELGRIANLLRTVRPEPTPLQRQLEHLARWLVLAALGVVAVVGILGLAQGGEPRQVLITAISLAVAAVPEGPPAVVTITLALGAQRMLRRQALIRKLSAVETLGSVTVICSDKTGTLTENRMVVAAIELPDGRVDLAQKAPALGLDPTLPDVLPSLALVGLGMALCNDAQLTDKEGEAIGDPTERAMVLAAVRLSLNKTELEREPPPG